MMMMIMDNGGHNDMNDGAWGLPGSGGGQLAMQMQIGNNFDDHVYRGVGATMEMTMRMIKGQWGGDGRRFKCAVLYNI